MEQFISEIESEIVSYTLPVPELKNALDRLMLGGAKRIRPKLALLVIKSYGCDVSKEQKTVIAAGEILHTASLIHDDIVDNSDKRRGTETLNALYDARLAVLAGDFLASFGMQKILSVNNSEVTNIFRTAFESMCRAEIEQYFCRGKIPELEEYLQKSTGKTASLFGAILKGTALLSQNMTPVDVYNLGVAYGTAFQIKNDLDAFIKTPERDVLNGIYTAPDIFYKETGNLNSAIEKTNYLIDNEIGKMFKIINNFPDNIYNNRLIEFIEESLCRTKK